ncbi:MAG TPA: MBL fold metallo-hydrolase, partial [Gaiellaceae bacterium]|nr:MBL fold metallo-hydrolase [Gaiellaceae bacterium]
MNGQSRIHRFPSAQDGAFVNAYLVETDAGVVAVDALLTVSESTAMRAAFERLGKPLHAVVLTQSHPDHYAGLAQLVAGDDVPVVAPQGVIDTIVRDDATKDAVVGPMFGDEWPAERIFPNTPIRDGESVTFDGVRFTVIDLGPSESPYDSPWILGDDETTVFLGDQIYDRRHCYLA